MDATKYNFYYNIIRDWEIFLFWVLLQCLNEDTPDYRRSKAAIKDFLCGTNTNNFLKTSPKPRSPP